jgi:hypothetical protein
MAIVPVFWASTVSGATLNVPSADYPNIQAAIDAALPGDTVSVAPGIYSGPGNVNLLIRGRAINIESQGGDRESCVIDCQGSGRAFTFDGIETNGSVLRGFTIKGGKVTDNGGAILCDNGASPNISACIITGNQAKYGGGIACLNNASPNIRDCDIEGNISSTGGGGLYALMSSPKVTECSISRNQGGYFGAGVYATKNSYPSFSSSLIALNSATYYGGGIWSSNSSSPKIINCTVADNTLSDPANGKGGGIYSSSGSVQINNSIFWRNVAVSGPEACLVSGAVVNVKSSNVKGGKTAVSVTSSTLDWDDATNKDVDPLFAGDDDYHLSPDSPCVDAGIDAGDLPEADFEGDPRVINDLPDMGADETRTEVIVNVDIDIWPGSRHNRICLHCKGIVPVAVLSSETFDARMINPQSVLFANAAPVRSVLFDVNRDHELDMLLLFRTKHLVLDETSTEATLTGETVDGVTFQGTDSVIVFTPRSKANSWGKFKQVFKKHAHHHCSK